MKLTVEERLLILDILPATGSLTTLRIVQELRQTLSFDEAEHEALKFKEDGSLIRWDVAAEADARSEFAIGPKAQEVVRKTLERLNEKEQLHMAHVPLCAKFGVEAD